MGEMERQQVLSMGGAVLRTFRAEGTRVMDNPSRFVGFVLDFVDVESPEARVLGHCCDAEFLEPFIEAAKGRSPKAVEEAAFRAANILDYEWVIKEDVAQRLSCQIALALCNHLGLPCSERVRTTATGRGSLSSEAGHASGVKGSASSGGASAYGRSGPTQVNGYSAPDGLGAGVAGRPDYHQVVPAGVGQRRVPPARRGTPVPQGVASQRVRQMPPQSVVASQGTTTQPVTLSADRATRLYEIEINGTRMNGYRFMLVLCAIACALWCYNVYLISTVVTPQVLGSFAELYAANQLYMNVSVVLALLQLLALIGLYHFKRFGPPTYLLAFGANGAAPAVYWNKVYQLAAICPKDVSLHYQSPEAIMLLLAASGLWLIVSLVYLVRRWQFFDL